MCSNIPIPGLNVSLCNTTTTSKQTLLGHADGRKHRAKAKAYHASQKKENGPEQTPNDKEIGGAPTTEPPQLNDGKGADGSEKGVDKDAVKRKRTDSTAVEDWRSQIMPKDKTYRTLKPER